MRIAIIGAGFAGLSTAWHLLQYAGCEVVLFDAKGVGGGASGIAAGLMHPYVGEEGRRSLLALEGLEAASVLVSAAEQILEKKVARRCGIVRHMQTEELQQLFFSHIQKYRDVKHLGENSFLIESAMTIDCPLYLQGLYQAIEAKGGKLEIGDVSDLKEIVGFDHVLVAAGAGIRKFDELKSLRFSVLKGQVLICLAPDSAVLPPQSCIGKGYVALSQDKGLCYVGSTYERKATSEDADMEYAKGVLIPKIRTFFKDVDKLTIVDCRAAMRVIRSGHYLPIAKRMNEGLWVLSAMGSRGLLYHGFLGKLMAEAIVLNDDQSLSFLSAVS